MTQSLTALSAAAPIFSSAATFGYEMISATSADILMIGEGNSSSDNSLVGGDNAFQALYKQFYRSINIDWEAYKTACNPQYCDYISHKSAWQWATDFIATLGGSWTIVFLCATIFWSFASTSFTNQKTSYVWK